MQGRITGKILSFIFDLSSIANGAAKIACVPDCKELHRIEREKKIYKESTKAFESFIKDKVSCQTVMLNKEVQDYAKWQLITFK